MFIVVTGGSGSGKSAYAENRVVSFQQTKRTYIATMFPFDQESHKRIARHREMRKDKGFETIECYTNLKHVTISDTGRDRRTDAGANLITDEDKNSKSLDSAEKGTVLLECMSNLTANEMFQEDGAGENTVEEIMKGIRSLRQQCDHLIVVTNEIFSDANSYEQETRTYLQYLGQINAEMAKEADEVVEVVFGIPIVHKRKKQLQTDEQ